ncbi:hypothetical protein VTK56DRAFT_3284 [Thermocarpiscus australiensis]
MTLGLHQNLYRMTVFGLVRAWNMTVSGVSLICLSLCWFWTSSNINLTYTIVRPGTSAGSPISTFTMREPWRLHDCIIGLFLPGRSDRSQSWLPQQDRLHTVPTWDLVKVSIVLLAS